MTIIDKIKMTFKFTGFEPYSSSFNERDNTSQNNYEVTIAYKGEELKFPYAFGTVNLDGLVTEVIESMFKFDILGKIVIDCFPPESFEKFKEEFETKGFKDDYLKEVYTDITAQSEKLRTLFDDNDLEQMKTDLSDWFDNHPNEADSLGWNKKEKEIVK